MTLNPPAMKNIQITTETDAETLNGEIYCRLGQSKIHGVGVIAIRRIPIGVTYNPGWNELRPQAQMISKQEWEKVRPEIQDLILTSGAFTDYGEDHYCFEHPNYHHIFFVNHSEEPNTRFGVALRDIEAGEEITRYCNGIHPEVIKHFARQGIIIKNDL